MKHISVISKGPAEAQLSTVQILTIVGAALSAVATVVTVVVQVLGAK
ncbi:MAG TPA: hypothetical protein PKI11_10995 [Candidatus Hydrogenedentes bacterium]|nr:hypothetical protein [Candidatus Hydrogenedentota bacterium]